MQIAKDLDTHALCAGCCAKVSDHPSVGQTAYGYMGMSMKLTWHNRRLMKSGQHRCCASAHWRQYMNVQQASMSTWFGLHVQL